MRFLKGIGALAALTVGATTLGACGSESANTQEQSNSEVGKVGSVGMAITLPDDSVVSSVAYTITGPAGFTRTGTVPVGDSTVLTFRIGGLPVGNGYSIALSSTTSFSNSCAGSATFNVVNNATTRVSVLLVCGATDNVGDLIVDGEFESCPVVTAIGAVPAEVRVGGSIALSSTISHGDTPVAWTGAGGTFSAAGSYNTTFACATVGTHVLTVGINSTEAACTNSATVEVVCSQSAGCGDGITVLPETCDDGNNVATDACNACALTFCGDGILRAGSAEECDDGNGSNADACSTTCLTIACGNGRVDPGEACDGTAGCNATTCQPLGCGDGIVTAPETCDDGNTVATDACTDTCRTAVCGDGVVRTGVEQCDDAGAAGGCTDTCTSPVVFGDIANQTAACSTCRQTQCTNYDGLIDAVNGCFTNSADPLFVQQCVDLMNCAYANDCGYNAAGIGECFCGTFDVSACQLGGNQNGDCIPEVYAAARTTNLSEVIGRLGAIEFPIGNALYLQRCGNEFCAACAP